MTKAQGSARAAQGWRQLDNRTARDSQHEDRVDDTLARYYRAVGRAERIRVAARRRAARVTAVARRKAATITSAAERDAAVPDAAAHAAVRELTNLVGGKAEVAELCGLTIRAVTDALAARSGALAAGGAAFGDSDGDGDGHVGTGSQEEDDDGDGQ